MWMLQDACITAMGAALAAGTMDPPGPPERFGLYYSGAPCEAVRVDRTFSQFQVNLGSQSGLVFGALRSDENGEAVLVRDDGRRSRLVTNASRADWLLSYPLVESGVGVWARPIYRSDCSLMGDRLYMEAMFPASLVGPLPDSRLDLMQRSGAGPLQAAVRVYRLALGVGSGEGVPPANRPASRFGAAARLERELFSPESARAGEPWRARLMGEAGAAESAGTVDILLSGSDGSVGMFGHIAVGGGGFVYNVYPKGSERGAPGAVPLWDYLFNAQRGQALRRPTWILRLEGLPADVTRAFHRDLTRMLDRIDDGSAAYHPTGNNCTTISLAALDRLGLDVPRPRYFTKRFPRPAFGHILTRLPRLVASGKLSVSGMELIYVPQVPIRISQGGAPNRPLRDRGRVDAPSVLRGGI